MKLNIVLWFVNLKLLAGISSSADMYIIIPAVAAIIRLSTFCDMFWNTKYAIMNPIAIGIAVAELIRNAFSLFPVAL